MSSRQTSKSNRPIGILRRLAAAAVTAALLAQPAAAEASTPPDIQPPAPTASAPPDAEPPVDLAVSSYAADYSVSLTEAQRRLDRNQPIQEILASIRDLEAARLAGWGIDHGSSFVGWVWLTGDDPPGVAAARVADAHADVEIRTGADHSYAELQVAQDRLFRNGATGRVNDGPASGIARMVTFTDIDMDANAVSIGIDPALASVVPGGLTDTGPVTVTDEAFQAKAAEVIALLADSIDVNFIIEDGRGLSVATTFMGGEGMEGAHACTSGFTARQRGTSVYGIITAAHCNTPFNMHGVRLSSVIRRHGPNVDARFLSIPTGSSHRILDDYGCGRHPCDVTGDISKSHMINKYICHSGRRSGISCGTVISTSFRPENIESCASICDSTFVRVEGEHLRGCSGDSGGPWYDRGIAYGIHGGNTDVDNCHSEGKRAYFSAIREVENELRVDILTGGSVTVP